MHRSWGRAELGVDEGRGTCDGAKKGFKRLSQEFGSGTSLVAEWIRIQLPVQGTGVQSLVKEDPTACEATKSVCHSYHACALGPGSCN